MLVRVRHLFGWLTGVFRSPADLIPKNLALRQQLLSLQAQRPRSWLGSPRSPVLGNAATTLVRLAETLTRG